MRVGLEENGGVFSSQVFLPGLGVHGRNEIHLVDDQHQLLALLENLRLKVTTTAAFGVSSIEHFNDNISSFDDLLQFFDIGASGLGHLS